MGSCYTKQERNGEIDKEDMILYLMKNDPYSSINHRKEITEDLPADELEFRRKLPLIQSSFLTPNVFSLL